MKILKRSEGINRIGFKKKRASLLDALVSPIQFLGGQCRPISISVTRERHFNPPVQRRASSAAVARPSASSAAVTAFHAYRSTVEVFVSDDQLLCMAEARVSSNPDLKYRGPGDIGRAKSQLKALGRPRARQLLPWLLF